jgi:glycosyltransferase involved in cell wall biosynthesis
MRLIIAGDGELFDEAKKRARESEVCDKIFLPGWKTDINNVLKDFDVYVLPSLYEAGPYTIIEAMAALLPVVATDVFGTKETIAQVSGNVIVPRGNPKALASGMRAVATLAEPRSLRRILRRIGQRNRDHALAHFTEDGTIQHTLEIYQALRA